MKESAAGDLIFEETEQAAAVTRTLFSYVVHIDICLHNCYHTHVLPLEFKMRK